MDTLTEKHPLEQIKGFEELKQTLAEVELEVLTEGFTLADAIREGSTTTGQAVGGFVKREANEVCALSAALMSAKARGLA